MKIAAMAGSDCRQRKLHGGATHSSRNDFRSASSNVWRFPSGIRDAVLRRDAEIRAMREETQRARSIHLPLQENDIPAPNGARTAG
jgi:hypothetical protein